MRLKLIGGVLIGIGVLAVGVVVAGYVVISQTDFNQYRGLIAEQVKSATGRELVIKGDLKAAIGLTPSVTVDEVSFANAPWGSRPQMAQVRRFEAQVALLPLLSGNIQIKRITLVDADVLLEKDAQGRANWQFDAGKPAPSGTPAGAPADSAGLALPEVDKLEIRNARLVFNDEHAKRREQISIAKALLTPQDASRVKVDLEGTYNTLKFNLAGETGRLVNIARPGTTFPVKLAGGIADVVALKIDGTVREPLAGKGYDVMVAAEGRELATVLDTLREARIANYRMTAFGPFKVAARLADDAPGGHPSVRDLKLEMGKSELVLVKAEGAVRDVLAQKGIALTASVEGKEIGALSGLSAPGLKEPLPKLPALGPYRASVRLASGAGDRPSVPELKVELGKPELIKVAVNGAITDPLAQKGIALNATVEGQEIGALSGLGVPGMKEPLPPIPAFGPYRAALRVASGPGDRPTVPELKVEIGRPELIRLVIDGAIIDPLAQKGVKISLNAEARDLAAVSAKVGAPAPLSGPLKLTARLADPAPGRYQVSDLALNAAGHDLSGDITVTTGGPRPLVVASLSSTSLDLDKLSAGLSGDAPAGTKKPAAKSERVFSDEPLPYDALKNADAELRVRLGKLVTSGVLLQNVSLTLNLKGGEMLVQPLTFDVSGGKMAIDANVNANRQSVALKIDGKGVDLGALLKSTKTSDYLDRGRTDVLADVRGSGRSMRAVMASLNGVSTLVVGEGSIDSRVFDVVGADLTSILNPISGGSGGRSALNCVINRLEIKDGVANSRALLTDTSNMQVTGEGSINLATEQLGMLLTPKARGAALANLAPPVRVSGTLANPSYTPDPAGTVKNIAGAVGGTVLLGPVGVLGALTGSPGSSGPTCQQVLTQLNFKPSVSVGGAGQPAGQQQPTQQPTQRQQQQPQQQQQQPAGPIEGIERGLRGIFGR